MAGSAARGKGNGEVEEVAAKAQANETPDMPIRLSQSGVKGPKTPKGTAKKAEKVGSKAAQ